MKKNKMIAFVLIVLASIIWGVSFISKEILMKDMHPGSILAFQMLCVFIIMAVYNFLIRKKFSISGRDFLELWVTGIVGMNLYNIFTNMGIKEINSSMVSVLLALIPIFCLFVDRFVYGRTFTRLKFLCILGSFIGVYMVIGSGGMSGSGSPVGYVYTVLGVLSWVLFCFIADKYYNKYDTTEILMVQCLGALSTSFFYLIIHPIQLELFTGQVLFHWFIIIILNACLSFAFYIVAIRELGVTVTNVFNNLVPVVTLFVNIVFFDVEIGMISILGTLVIVLSVVVLNVFDRDEAEYEGREKFDTKLIENID